MMSNPESPPHNINWSFVVNVVARAFVLFILLNGIYALLDPLPALSKISLYNALIPGRQRLPFGENPEAAYNLSLFQLDAMFASHEVTQTKPADEYRVLVLGDSSVWGILLRPNETLAGAINAAGYAADDGRQVRAYNLGYPTLSLTKDLMLLADAMPYRPDLIVWMVTLESFPYNKQLSSPIVQNNPELVRELIERYNLNLDADDSTFVDPSFWSRTIVGQRRGIADVIRLNLYGPMWAATGIDQYYPESYTPLQTDFEPDDSFYDLRFPLTVNDLALDVLAAGVELAGDVPVLIINEPIYIGSGKNSDIRYNFYYPRWAYDEYRRLLAEQARAHDWRYFDLWDAISPDEFTNSAIHITPAGTAQLAGLVGAAITGER